MHVDLMTTAQVCDVLKRDHRTIRRMIEAGRIAVVQKLPGERGAYLFDPGEIRRVAAELADETRARIPDAEAV
jgi:excisionase family DNA binding protein